VRVHGGALHAVDGAAHDAAAVGGGVGGARGRAGWGGGRHAGHLRVRFGAHLGRLPPTASV
jgi:hypothetical protein